MMVPPSAFHESDAVPEFLMVMVCAAGLEPCGVEKLSVGGVTEMPGAPATFTVQVPVAVLPLVATSESPFTCALKTVVAFTVTCVDPFAAKFPFTPLIVTGVAPASWFAFDVTHESATGVPGATVIELPLCPLAATVKEIVGAGTV